VAAAFSAVHIRNGVPAVKPAFNLTPALGGSQATLAVVATAKAAGDKALLLALGAPPKSGGGE